MKIITLSLCKALMAIFSDLWRDFKIVRYGCRILIILNFIELYLFSELGFFIQVNQLTRLIKLKPLSLTFPFVIEYDNNMQTHVGLTDWLDLLFINWTFFWLAKPVRHFLSLSIKKHSYVSGSFDQYEMTQLCFDKWN